MKWTKAFRKSAGKEMTVVSSAHKLALPCFMGRKDKLSSDLRILHEISEIIIDYNFFTLLRTINTFIFCAHIHTILARLSF